MTRFLKSFYDTEGPFGLPMKDCQAQALDVLLKVLPKDEAIYSPRQVVIDKAPAEMREEERADISWISTEDPDRDREVVIARGMDDSHFKLNPIVTMQHAYWLPPVGKSLWRKRSAEKALIGIKAKTEYPARPASWPEGTEWPADGAFMLIRAGLLLGKSIGFLPTKVHVPDDRERERQGWRDVRLVIDEWVLLEYACVFLPAQQHALVESVSKGLHLSDSIRSVLADTFPSNVERWKTRTISFTPFEEIEKALQRRLDAIDLDNLAQRTVTDALDRARGRV